MTPWCIAEYYFSGETKKKEKCLLGASKLNSRRPQQRGESYIIYFIVEEKIIGLNGNSYITTVMVY